MKLLSRLTCRSVRRLLWEYAAERLSEGPMESVERHTAECTRCRRELEGLRRAQRLLVTYRRQEPPVSGANWASLRQRLLTEQASAPRSVPALDLGGRERVSFSASWRPHLAKAGSFAVVMILAGAGFGVFGTKMALQSSPPALPDRPEPAAPAAGNTARTNTAATAATSVASSTPFAVPVFPLSDPATHGRAEFHKKLATAAPTHTAPAKTASKVKTAVPARSEESAARAAKNDSSEKRRNRYAGAGRAVAERPQTKADDSPARSTTEEAAPITLSHRYVMGTLTPVPHDDDAVY